jgi:serine/threonine-protein kinase
MATVIAHIQQPPRPPRNLNARIPEDLEALILKCIEKEPSARYAKVADVLKDLTAVSSRIDASAA